MFHRADVSFIQDSTSSKDHLGIMEAFQYAVKAVNEDLKHDKYIIEIKQRRNITEIDNRFLLTNQSKNLVIVGKLLFISGFTTKLHVYWRFLAAVGINLP